MKEAAYILFGAAFTTAASYSAGSIVLRRLRIELYRQEERVFAFLLGSAVLSWLVFLMAAAHVVYKGTLLVLGGALIAAGWRASTSRAFPALPRKWVWAAAPVFLLFSLLYVCHAMAPEMSPDGSSYHLGLVARYYREHGFPAITTNMYASLSQSVDLLFLFAFPWGRHSSTALTHLVFLFALASLILSYGRRFGFPLAAFGSAALVFLAPVAAIDAASAYNDVALAAVVFGTFYLLQVWDQERHNSLLVAIGVLCGFAFAIKYTAFVALPYAVGFVIWKWRRQSRWILRSIATIVLVSAVWIAPWLIKNTIVVGNPVSPFANQIFRNPYVHVSFEEGYRVSMRNYDLLKSHWDIPMEVTIRGQALGGLLGPVFLLTPLALLSWRKPHGRRLLVAALVFGSVYATNVGTRFLLMAAPFAALALSLVLSRYPTVLVLTVAAHAVLSWPDVMKLYCETSAWRLDRIQWKAALRRESEDGFLRRKWPAYGVAKMVDSVTPRGSVIFTFGQIAEAYCTREVLVSFQSARGEVLRGILWTPIFGDMQPTRTLNFAFPELRTRSIRLIQTTSGSGDHFAAHEVRFFSRGRDLPRGSHWRLRTWPNPWDVQFAFDASPVTRWSSWERLRPGMYIEVNFGREEALDRVLVETSPETRQSRIRLDIAPEVQATEVEAPPPLGLRREAIEVVRERGVTHLLVADGDFGASDYFERREDWGLDLVGEQAGVKLYALR